MLISIKNISLRYNEKSLFSNFSLDIRQGEKVALKGMSGVGKTSVLNILLGFVKPDAGKIFYENEKLSSKNIRKLRSNLSYLPQEIHFSNMGVKEFLLLPFGFEKNKHLKPSDKKLKIYLDKFLLEHEILNKQMTEISGGEKQRIALISCLLLEREFMIFDEPTSALDKKTKAAVMDFIFTKKELTLLSTTHDDDWINRCDKVVELQQNKYGN